MSTSEQRRYDQIVRDVLTELAALVTPEVNQLLTSVVTNADAALGWLNRKEPRLDEAEAALARIASDGLWTGKIIRCLGGLADKSGPNQERLDIDDAIGEVLVLTRSVRKRTGAPIRLRRR